jgi:hypothetical protein
VALRWISWLCLPGGTSLRYRQHCRSSTVNVTRSVTASRRQHIGLSIILLYPSESSVDVHRAITFFVQVCIRDEFKNLVVRSIITPRMVTDAKCHYKHGGKNTASCARNTSRKSNIVLDIHSQLSYTSITQAAERFPQK